ncbi:MAG TPA: AAA family ATPase [Candidatus Caldiarchaeum subterraneum]|uniref:ORC1-type DNA replication protein n=1 Tax=Caldiarchaeum subterraneum TaxID=311458 RepID=A0A833A3Y4_CALS0|nr:AAA family ATPase [Candidatus Caldarchaeum subterraneum]
MRNRVKHLSSDEDSGLHKKIWGGDPLADVLKRLDSGVRIIKNRDVLRADYIPDSLPHRAEHIRRMGEILAPCIIGGRPSNLFIYGKTGTGKTAVAKHVFRRFSEEAERRNARVKFIYINCRIAGTEYRILSEMCYSLGVKIPFTGLSKAEVFNRLKKALSDFGGLLVVCLDEIDMLVKSFGDDLLYELTRGPDQETAGRLTITGISNDLMFKEQLDPRVLSSLSEEEIVFHPYTAGELADILRERAEKALREGSYTEAIIRLCAAKAAAEHGDARRALDLLRVAAEVAERGGNSMITEKHVIEAQGLIERGRVHEALRTLPLHSKILLISLLAAGNNGNEIITSGSLYSIYKKLCTEAGVEPLTDRRVSTLVSELDMLGIVSCDLVSYGRHGRTRRIKLAINKDELINSFSDDDFLSSVIELSL